MQKGKEIKTSQSNQNINSAHKSESVSDSRKDSPEKDSSKTNTRKDFDIDKRNNIQSNQSNNNQLSNDTEKEDAGFDALSKKELVIEAKKRVNGNPVQDIKDDVETIKIIFYKKHRAEIESKRKHFINEGGRPEDFKLSEDELEKEFKEIYKRFKNLKADYNRRVENEKLANLKRKFEIIEEIKKLVERKESMKKTFDEFYELQRQWRDTGPVPPQNNKDVWNTYHHHVENFYDYIKINKELRDLDLKKNLEAKLELCKKAEALLDMKDALKAFRTLQEYHDQWRTIGPVQKDKRATIWDRFSKTTKIINKRHQDHFKKIKEQQINNLHEKQSLCEQAEQFAEMEIKDHDTWNEKTSQLINLQKKWKTIGFTPKKDNNKIYNRFRKACDAFFNKKKAYYESIKGDIEKNLKTLENYCKKAEELLEADDWEKAKAEIIELQKKWKEIKPLPKNKEGLLYRKFRFTCDKFFENRDKIKRKKEEENLKAKQTLLDEIKKYQPVNDQKKDLQNIRTFQKKWSQIGFVPIKQKDEIEKAYRDAIDKHLDTLDIDEKDKKIIKFKNKLNNISKNQKSNTKINFERDKLVKKLKQLENDIILWENNVGFFNASKGKNNIIDDIYNKIEKAKKDKKEIEDKIKIIDNYSKNG